jgi:SagB-type dehydrogenase family enzyme
VSVLAGLVLLCGVMAGETDSVIRLPEPDTTGRVTVEQTLQHRRSVRAYAAQPLTLREVGQLLWAAQGVTGEGVLRTSPSAGATYPMELYLVCGSVTGLEPGLYHYRPDGHSLTLLGRGDLRQKLADSALGQGSIKTAAAVLILAAQYERTTKRYGERGTRYVHMEAGHIGENVHLQCEALGLGTVMIGAFQDEKVKRLLGIAEEPLYIMPVGRRKE